MKDHQETATSKAGKTRTEPNRGDHSPAAVSHRAWKRRGEMKALIAKGEEVGKPRLTEAKKRLKAIITEADADQLKAKRAELKRRYGKRRGKG